MNKSDSTGSKYFIREICEFISHTFFVSYLVFLIINYIQENFISTFFNINILLLAAVISGLITLLLNNKASSSSQVPSHGNITTVILLSAAGLLVVLKFLLIFGFLGYLISILVGLLIFLLTMSVLQGKAIKNKS